MKRFLLFAVALALSACSTLTPPASVAGAPAPTRSDTILAVASTAATVADAIGQAPPATLSRTTIDDKAIRLAFKTFDHALDVVDAFVASGAIVRNSPTALTIRRAILATQSALNAASAAQRAGSATTYSEALRQAQAALASLETALAR